MKKRRVIKDYLEDIINECEYILNRSQNLTYTDFVENEELKKAFVRALEIIGEAEKNKPQELREISKDRMESLVGMRDKLIHGYLGVDYKRVWETVIRDIPKLKPLIDEIIKDIEGGKYG